jgi:hypothetical protein
MFFSRQDKPGIQIIFDAYHCTCCNKQLGGVGEICRDCANTPCENCGEIRIHHGIGGDCPPCKSCWHRLDIHDRATGNCAESECGCSAARSTEAAKHQKNVAGVSKHQRKIQRVERFDEFKGALLDLFSNMGPPVWRNVLGALQGFQTSDVYRLNAMYSVIFEEVATGLTGEDIDIKRVEAHLPRCADDLPTFFELGELGQLFVTEIHRTLGTDQANEVTQDILSQPDHPVNTLETIAENYQNGMVWNNEWANNPTIILDPPKDTTAFGDPVFVLQPGDFKMTKFKVEKVEPKKSDSAVAIVVGPEEWWAFQIDKKGRPSQANYHWSSKKTDPVAVSPSHSDAGWNLVEVSYPAKGAINLSLNGIEVVGNFKPRANQKIPISFATRNVKVKFESLDG